MMKILKREYWKYAIDCYQRKIADLKELKDKAESNGDVDTAIKAEHDLRKMYRTFTLIMCFLLISLMIVLLGFGGV